MVVSRGGSLETEPVRLDEKTAKAPALTPWADSLPLAWTGTDERLNLATVT